MFIKYTTKILQREILLMLGLMVSLTSPDLLLVLLLLPQERISQGNLDEGELKTCSSNQSNITSSIFPER